MIARRKFNVNLNKWILIIPIALFAISSGFTGIAGYEGKFLSADSRSRWKVAENSAGDIYIFKSPNGEYILTECCKLFLPSNMQIKYPGVLTVSDIDSFIKYQVGSGDYSFHF
jgi:hypothetical protein